MKADTQKDECGFITITRPATPQDYINEKEKQEYWESHYVEWMLPRYLRARKIETQVSPRKAPLVKFEKCVGLATEQELIDFAYSNLPYIKLAYRYIFGESTDDTNWIGIERLRKLEQWMREKAKTYSEISL